MRFDLHTHTRFSPSDGILEPVRLVKAAKKKGLSGIAVTDHNTIKGGIKAKKLKEKGLQVIVGSEVRSTRGEIIGLFISEEIMSKKPVEIFEEIKDQGGLVLIPHPFDEMRSSAFKLKKSDVKHIDAIETFNSRCVFQKYNDSAQRCVKKWDLGVCAGSDAHYAGEVGNAGIITEDDDVFSALARGKTRIFGRRSPILYHGFTKLTKYKRRFLN